MSFRPFGSSVDHFFVDLINSDLSLLPFGFGDNSAFAAVADARKDRHVFKPEVGSAVKIRGERTRRLEEKTDTRRRVERVEKTDTRHRVERAEKTDTRHRVERAKKIETRTWHRVERGKTTETRNCVEREKTTEIWNCVEREKKTDTKHRVAGQKKTDSFRLPANVKANQVKIAGKPIAHSHRA